MEFASGISIDLKDGNTIEMRREINQFTYRPPNNLDTNTSASSNTITTSLGVVLPKTGAGSEYGREQKEALKRKRYATRGTNIEDLPWQLTNRLTSEKKLKHFRGMKKGGITENSSYYVFIQNKDGFEAHPVEDWYSFTPTNVYETLDYDEAEKQYEERHKKLSKWFSTHKVTKEKDEDDAEIEKGKRTVGMKKNDLQLLDIDEWRQQQDDGR
jgi:transcription initiation factor TFIIF subunit alpha